MKAESNAPLWIVAAVLVAAALVFSGKNEHSEAAVPDPVAAVPDAPEPVSGECDRSARLAGDKGLVSPGTANADGMVLLTDARWPTLDASLQQYTAECLSHYLAGGQNRWVKRIQFRNQRTGVVYGTIEGDRYRIGP
jgi:hypothetical protein